LSQLQAYIVAIKKMGLARKVLTLQQLHGLVGYQDGDANPGFALSVVPWEQLIEFGQPRAQVLDSAPFFRSYLALEGSGVVSSDAYVYPWQAPCWIFFFPEQAWHWHIQHPPRGYVGVFDRAYLFEGETLEVNLMIDHSFDTVLPLRTHLREMTETCLRCVEELTNPLPYTPQIVVQQKKLFLLYISRNLRLYQLPEKPSENQLLVLRLQELFAQRYRELKTVGALTDRLHVTERKLNLACKEVTGQTAKEWLDLMLYRMAESQIWYDRRSLAEIALNLGFEEPSTFSRFIRRMSGLSPTELREARPTATKD
jgi:AraC-like DNA-binding protein